MPSPSEIVRCLKLDMGGDLLAGARYAEQISFNASMNPWGDPADAPNYSEAARRLRAEHEQRSLTTDH